MQKNILLEINRVREIMGLKLVIEQEDIVAGEAVDANAYKQVGGGQPYELFLEKSDATSKLYMESTGEETTVSQKFKYRKKNPFIIRIEKANIKIEGLDDTEKNYEVKLEKLNNYIEKQKNQFKKYLDKGQNFDEEYRYTNDKSVVRKERKSDNPYEENPNFIEGSKKLKVDVPLTPEEKVALMEKIENFVNKKYDGDYDAAADTKKKSSKTKYTRYYGIDSIRLFPKDVDVIEEKPAEAPKVVAVPGLDFQSENLTDQGSNTVFPDNEWEPGPLIKMWAQDVIKSLAASKQQWEKQGYSNITISMDNKKLDDSGKEVDFPYTISTSASRIPNGGKAADKTFLQLSELRAKSTAAYLKEVFGGAGIKMVEPILDFQGDGKANQDGSTGGASGPEWNQDRSPSNRARYESSKYCNIQCNFRLSSPGFELEEEPGTPGTPGVTKVGEWKLIISRRSKGRPFQELLRGIKNIKIRWPRIRLPKIRFGRRTMNACEQQWGGYN